MKIKWDDGNEYPADKDPINNAPIGILAEFQLASGMKLADIDKVQEQDSLAIPVIFWFGLHRAGIPVSWTKLCQHPFKWFTERVIEEPNDTQEPASSESDPVPKEPISGIVGRHEAQTSNT